MLWTQERSAALTLTHETIADREGGHLGGCGRGEIGDRRSYVPSVWSGLIERFGIKNALDIGCGFGYATKWFHEHGVDCFGIDGFEKAINETVVDDPARVELWDFSEGPFPFAPLGPRDLCWCSEFAEHVDQQYENNWLASATLCRVVALTAALPGHPGHHHVNCQWPEYWIRRFDGLGYWHDKTATSWLRAVANEAHPGSYFGNRGLVFVRRPR